MSSQQEYFVPGFGISRQVMFSHIQFYLGPYASVRPYSYQVRTIYSLPIPHSHSLLPTLCPLHEGHQTTRPSGIGSRLPGPRRIPSHGTRPTLDQGTFPHLPITPTHIPINNHLPNPPVPSNPYPPLPPQTNRNPHPYRTRSKTSRTSPANTRSKPRSA